MADRYEDIEEVQEALKKRGCFVTNETLRSAMTGLGLNCPLGDLDIGDLVDD